MKRLMIFYSPIIPGVAESAGFAPVKVKMPPSFRKLEAIEADMTELQTDCLIIKSVFLAKSLLAFPPAQPPYLIFFVTEYNR